MFGSFSPFWIVVFTFQVLLCLFGVFSQNVFMRTTVWDKKITFHCRVYLFFLSVGYQLILVSFVGTTIICWWTTGSIFEVPECKEAKTVPFQLHHFGEFTVVVFNLFINIDRLMVAFKPRRSNANVCCYASCLVSFVIGALYVDSLRHKDIRWPIAVISICLVNFLNLIIEVKLFHYTNVVYKNTIGTVPLERRFELSTSVTMIRCFLPASVCDLVLKFSIFFFYFFVIKPMDPSDHPPLIFVLQSIWNLDCTLFPWFFILFHPSKMEKLKRVLRIRSATISQDQYYQRPAPQTQQQHFDQFKNVWKVER